MNETLEDILLGVATKSRQEATETEVGDYITEAKQAIKTLFDYVIGEDKALYGELAPANDKAWRIIQNLNELRKEQRQRMNKVLDLEDDEPADDD